MREALQQAMLDALPKQHSYPEINRFYNYLHDYPSRSGKLIRGQFVLLACEAHGGNWQDALKVAAALELFQNWVLIHDDIEDDSDERRGKPAMHRSLGMPVALNVGDALHVYMWQLLHHLDMPNDAWRNVLYEFETMIHRTAEGQHLDLSWVEQGRFDISEADYLQMVTLKTAYYTVVCPLHLGAFVAEKVPSDVDAAAIDMGIAFQIRDDVLNLMPDISYGKEFAGDLYEAKRTLILAHTFQHASSDEKVELESRLAKPRNSNTQEAIKTQEDVNAILAIINKHKSLDYAQSVAEERASRGLAVMKTELAKLPNQEASNKILDILESLATRKV